MVLLSLLEKNPVNEAVAIWLYRNISLQGALEAGWPEDGYLLQNPVYFSGRADSQRTVLDLDLIPSLVRIQG